MTHLEDLLIRLRDGELDDALLAEVRRALRAETRLPEELRELEDLEQDPIGAAEALLGVLGHEPDWLGGLISEALRVEAGLGAHDVAPERFPPEGVDEAMLDEQERTGLPPVASAVRFEAGRAEIVVGVLRTIGVTEPPLLDAVAFEAGNVDVAAAAVTRLGHVPLPVDEAVRAEAGGVGVAQAWAGQAFPLRQAVALEAGRIQVRGPWDAQDVSLVEALAAEAGGIELGGLWPALPLAEAVRAEAGRAGIQGPWVDDLPIREAIAVEGGSIELEGPWTSLPLVEALRIEAGTMDVVEAVMARVQRSSIAPDPLPERSAANRGGFWTYAGLALAAVALFALVIGRLMPLGGMGLVDLPDFAKLGEVQVEDLSYGEQANAAVIPFEDEEGNGVLVIWVEEETGA